MIRIPSVNYACCSQWQQRVEKFGCSQHLIWSNPPTHICVVESGEGYVSAQLGAQDLDDGKGQMGPYLHEDPELIIVAHTSMTAEEISQRPGWEQLTAIKNGAICTDLDQDVIFRSGPRLMEGVYEFFHCLYPDYPTPTRSTP